MQVDNFERVSIAVFKKRAPCPAGLKFSEKAEGAESTNKSLDDGDLEFGDMGRKCKKDVEMEGWSVDRTISMSLGGISCQCYP